MERLDYTKPAAHRHDDGCENRDGDLACGYAEIEAMQQEANEQVARETVQTVLEPLGYVSNLVGEDAAIFEEIMGIAPLICTGCGAIGWHTATCPANARPVGPVVVSDLIDVEADERYGQPDAIDVMSEDEARAELDER